MNQEEALKTIKYLIHLLLNYDFLYEQNLNKIMEKVKILIQENTSKQEIQKLKQEFLLKMNVMEDKLSIIAKESKFLENYSQTLLEKNELEFGKIKTQFLKLDSSLQDIKKNEIMINNLQEQKFKELSLLNDKIEKMDLKIQRNFEYFPKLQELSTQNSNNLVQYFDKNIMILNKKLENVINQHQNNLTQISRIENMYYETSHRQELLSWSNLMIQSIIFVYFLYNIFVKKDQGKTTKNVIKNDLIQNINTHDNNIDNQMMRKVKIFCFENLTKNDKLLVQFQEKLKKEFSIQSIIVDDIKKEDKILFLNRVEERLDAKENEGRLNKIKSLQIEDWKWFNFSKKSDITNRILIYDEWNPRDSEMSSFILDKENENIWKQLSEWKL